MQMLHAKEHAKGSTVRGALSNLHAFWEHSTLQNRSSKLCLNCFLGFLNNRKPPRKELFPTKERGNYYASPEWSQVLYLHPLCKSFLVLNVDTSLIAQNAAIQNSKSIMLTNYFIFGCWAKDVSTTKHEPTKEIIKGDILSLKCDNISNRT
jgi:hypothetical protein